MNVDCAGWQYEMGTLVELVAGRTACVRGRRIEHHQYLQKVKQLGAGKFTRVTYWDCPTKPLTRPINHEERSKPKDVEERKGQPVCGSVCI